MPFNPDNFDIEISPEEPENSESIKEEAKSFQNKFSEKTFGEKVFSEYQTRKANVRGTEIERGETFRFERGQIYKGYMILRKEIREAEKRGENTTSKKDLLKEIRIMAKVMERDLDDLNRQYYENMRNVEIETEFGNFTVPVVKLDFKKDKDGKEINPEDDKRIPYFLLGGIASSYHQMAAISLALALDGHIVYTSMQPEQPSVKKPANFGKMLSMQENLKIHSDIAKETIKKIGLSRVNVIGYSTGATTALELAVDPDFEGLNDLIVIEPLGIEDMWFLELAKRFGIDQALRTLLSSEGLIKSVLQGAKEGQGELNLSLKTAKILSKKHFTPEILSEINPAGRFQLWMGKQSPLMNKKIFEEVFLEMERLRQGRDSGVSPLELYEVASNDHTWPMKNALGLSGMITEERPSDQITQVKTSDLENSAMQRIIKNIKNK